MLLAPSGFTRRCPAGLLLARWLPVLLLLLVVLPLVSGQGAAAGCALLLLLLWLLLPGEELLPLLLADALHRKGSSSDSH